MVDRNGGEDCDVPYYTWDEFHRDGVPWSYKLEMFVIPSGSRRNGEGRKFYEKFESELPESVKLVTLIAADLGSGETQAFWGKMGFSLVTEIPESVNGEHYYVHMQKGVNGYPTPQTLPAEAYDEEYWPTFDPAMRSEQELKKGPRP